MPDSLVCEFSNAAFLPAFGNSEQQQSLLPTNVHFNFLESTDFEQEHEVFESSSSMSSDDDSLALFELVKDTSGTLYNLHNFSL